MGSADSLKVQAAQGESFLIAVAKRLFAGLLLMTMASGGRAAGEPLSWPLAIRPVLSSTFGETRATALHAGIDLKTWGRTGYEVRAVADGWVQRLRTSPWGYGRVVYQPLSDGRIVVYAHLENFAPALAAQVEAAQREKGWYSVDRWFTAGELPVTRGQLLGWTGESGAGPPHLHLELRDAENRPLNPLRHGFSVEDTIPPVFYALALIPRGRRSTVDGGYAPSVFAVRWNEENGAFETDRVLTTHGSIGVAALVDDRADGAFNALAPYRTVLRVDGRQVFVAEYGHFSYADAHQVFLDRTWLEFGGRAQAFFNLFRLPGNRLEFYHTGPELGVLACGTESEGIPLAKGRYRIEVEAEDAAGNVSRARFVLQVNAPPLVTAARLSDDARFLTAVVWDEDDAQLEAELASSPEGEHWEVVDTQWVARGPLDWELSESRPFWRIQVRDRAGDMGMRICASPAAPGGKAAGVQVARQVYRDFVELTIRTDEALVEAPRVRAGEEELPVRQLGLREYRATVVLVEGGGEELEVTVAGRSRNGSEVVERLPLAQRAVHPGVPGRHVFGAGELVLVVHRDSAYEPFFPQADPLAAISSGELLATGVGYQLAPAGISFDRRIEIWLRYPEETIDPEKLGVYRYQGNGRWALAGNEWDREQGMIGARVRQLGRFALLADETPPVIGELFPATGAVLDDRRPRLSAWIEDRGAGIGREQDIVMELNGARVISEYDPDAKRVFYPVREALSPGTHEWLIRVRDQSGNQAAVRSRFTVR